MAYDPALADRIRELIAAREDRVDEKTMFGGLAFMVNDKICVTTRDDRILVRLSPQDYEIEVHGEGCRPMIHSGREMKGFIFVTGPSIQTTTGLRRWVNMALDYNAEAKATPKAPKTPRKKATRKK
jgi:TfoX/Sxy family transcriptional regulator of competence genes